MRERQNIIAFSDLLGTNSDFLLAVAQAKRVASTDVNTLIDGPPGTGKELFAQAIHYNSKRRGRPLVTLNSSALPDNLLESELFGYKPGSFTGACENGRIGLLETAHGGTLFLDEVANMSLAMQAKLLRAIEQKEITPLGTSKSIPANFRVICATNKDLQDCVADGTFREDLYYRINVVRIDLLPLVSRKEDIPLLANHFLDFCCKKHDRKTKTFSSNALAQLVSYHWPGNIRELKNACERAVVLCQTDTIHSNDLKQDIIKHSLQLYSSEVKKQIVNFVLDHGLTIGDLKRILIEKILMKFGENQSLTSKILGISRTTIWKHKKDLDLKLKQRHM